MRTIAMTAFLASTATTGTVTAAALFWAVPATLGALAIGGWVMMAVTAQRAFGDRKSPHERMMENRTHLHLSRPQIRRRPLGPLSSPGPNGRRRRRSVLVGAPGSMVWPGRVERH